MFHMFTIFFGGDREIVVMVYNTIVLCSTCLLRGGWWRDCGYDTIMLFIHIVNFNYSKHHVNKLFRLFCEFLPITFSNHELHELY